MDQPGFQGPFKGDSVPYLQPSWLHLESKTVSKVRGSASPWWVSAAAGGKGPGGPLDSPTDHLPRTGPELSTGAKREEEGAQKSRCLPTCGPCFLARRNLYGGSHQFPEVWLLGPAPSELCRQLGVRLCH